MKYVKFFLIALLAICVGLFVYWTVEQLQQVKTFLSSKETVSNLQDSIQALKNDVASLQDSVKNILAKNPDIDVQMRLNHLDEEVNLYRDDVRHSVNEYHNKMDIKLNIISILMAALGIFAALFGLIYPYIENKKLEKKIDEVRIQVDKADKITKQAEEAEKKRQNIASKNAENYYKLGITYYQQGSIDNAMRCFDKAIENNDNLPMVYFYRGLTNYNILGPNAALEDIDKAIDSDNYYADAYYIKALLEFEIGKTLDAIKDLDHAKSLDVYVNKRALFTEYLKGNMKDLHIAINCGEYINDMKKLIRVSKLITNYFIIPSFVTEIGEKAFDSIYMLTSIKIPFSVAVIGEDAFNNCPFLNEIIVDENNPNYCSVNGVLYSKDMSKLIAFPEGKESYKFPEGMTEIEKMPFSTFSPIKSVMIPKTVTKILEKAFDGILGLKEIKVDEKNPNFRSFNGVLYSKDMTKLIAVPKEVVSIELPEGITKIGKGFFKLDFNIRSVMIPKTVTEVEDNVFDDIWGLKEINVDEKNLKYGSVNGVLYSKDMTKLIAVPSHIESIKLPKGMTMIRKSVFSDCRRLKSVEIPKTVIEIENKAFDNCFNLKEIIVDEKNPKFCSFNGVLYSKDMTKLIAVPYNKDSIKLPDGITKIDEGFFNHHVNIKSVEIPKTVTEIEIGTFHHCLYLKEIKVDENNLNYSSMKGVLYSKNMTKLIAFPACNDTKEIPESVTEIGNYAFYFCTSLNTIKLPSIVVIGDYAFCNCTRLDSIGIPDGVTLIGDHAFKGCTNLVSIEIPISVVVIGVGVFSRCTSLKSIIVDKNNPYYCSEDGALFKKEMDKMTILISVLGGKEAVIIPDTVNKIEEDAFNGCTNLKSIIVDENNPNYCSIDGVLFTNDENTLINVPGGKEKIIIPETVNKIEIAAFRDCTNLKVIHLKNTTPDDFSAAFNLLKKTEVTIYVPKGSGDDYINSEYFVNFKEVIKEEEGEDLKDIIPSEEHT